MGLRDRGKVAAPAVDSPTPGDKYEGQHCFHEGFYYVVKNDDHGVEVGPDWDSKLVWHEAGYLVHAAPEDVNHFHKYGHNPVELSVGGE